ncbi:MAG: response regulator transcription factor [Haloferacaceae archaeon]
MDDETGEEGTAPTEGTREEGAASAGNEPTVLVVEDNEDIVETYRLWLFDDFDVRTATDGEAALEAVDGAVDVILLDRMMPGLSGAEVLARVRDRGYDCRVAMVTAVEPDFDILEMGFDAYLTKPVTESELRETIDRLLAHGDYTDTLDRYTRLLAKREALRASKSPAELEGSEEYAALEAEMEELNEDLDPTVVGLGDDEGFVATLRGIEGDGDGNGETEGEGDAGTDGNADGGAFGEGVDP